MSVTNNPLRCIADRSSTEALFVPTRTITWSKAFDGAMIDRLDGETMLHYMAVVGSKHRRHRSESTSFQIQGSNGPYSSTSDQQTVGFAPIWDLHAFFRLDEMVSVTTC